MAYGDLKKGELQDLCRDRGLPVSGTVDELVARLRGWDQAQDEPDLHELAQQSATTTDPDEDPTQEQPPESVAEPAQEQAPEPEPDAEAEPRTFEQLYECPGVLPTELHEQWVTATAQAAADAGVRIRGGAYRSGYRYRNGTRYAVYEISRARR